MKTKNLKNIAVLLLLVFYFSACNSNMSEKEDVNMLEKEDIDMTQIDFSNIENLYEQPLPVIQKCVQGKWKWYVQFGGVIGISYSENTYVNINDDHFIIEYEDGSQQKTYFTWKQYSIDNKGCETWMMWDNERDHGIWYFDAIKNDTLGVGHVPLPHVTFNQFSSGFSRVK